MHARFSPGAVRKIINTGVDRPSAEIEACVAEIEGRDVAELTSMGDWVDNVLTDIFGEARATTAQVQLAFNYEGYRVTIDQIGVATFDRLDDWHGGP